MKTIDITTTATLRPELLKKTYTMFWDNVFSQYPYEYRIIINVDPIGDSRYCQEDVLEVAESFSSQVVYIIALLTPISPQRSNGCG